MDCLMYSFEANQGMYVFVRSTIHFLISDQPPPTVLVERRSTTAGSRTQERSWGGRRSSVYERPCLDPGKERCVLVHDF